MGRKVSYNGLLNEVHRKVLDMRNIESLVNRVLFGRLWFASSEEERKRVYKLVLEGDREALEKWIEDHPDIDLGEMSHRKLKRLGQKLRIKNYSRLDRVELAQKIEERLNAES